MECEDSHSEQLIQMLGAVSPCRRGALTRLNDEYEEIVPQRLRPRSKGLMLIVYAISRTAGPQGHGRPFILKQDEPRTRCNGSRCECRHRRN